MIELRGLNKIFDTAEGQTHAVRDVDMVIDSGDICVLLGPSGCGKTTTLKMINGLIPKTAGKIFLDGQDTDELDPVALRRRIGYVIQQIGLFPNMTIEDNVCSVPDLLGWDKAKSRREAADWLSMVNLDPSLYLKRYPNELSGGQQQRAGVARALAARPTLMLMDEPFGAIDPINRDVIQDEFLKIQRDLGITVILVSHDLDEAIKLADQIAIFNDGQLIQSDSPDRLLAQPKLGFVDEFLGSEKTLMRLSLRRCSDVYQPGAGSANGPSVLLNESLRTVSSTLIKYGADSLPVTHEGVVVGTVSQAAITAHLADENFKRGR